jgi:nicotinamidase-related amidase
MNRDLGVWTKADVNSPTQPAPAAELPDIEPIDRSSMNAFDDQAFRDAVAATGRMRLIMGGLVTEVCLAFAAVEALKASGRTRRRPSLTEIRVT